MDIERELERLEEWIADLMPDALVDAQAAFQVLDILDEMAALLGLGEGREGRPGE